MKMAKVYNMVRLINNKCMQFENASIGIALYNHVHGDVCKVCPKYSSSKTTCETLIAIEQLDKDKRKRLGEAYNYRPPGETVRDEAKRRGISIQQVRKQRRDKL